MASTIERVEEMMQRAGFTMAVPTDPTCLAGGDGNVTEEAPIGYYRFHFFKSNSIPLGLDHENWVSNTDIVGPMCISLIRHDKEGVENKTFYRILIRSPFGVRSVIIFEDDFEHIYGMREPTKVKILGAALKYFLEDEKERFNIMEEEFGALSIRSSCTTTSYSSELVRFLPTSRLRDAHMNNLYSMGAEGAVGYGHGDTFNNEATMGLQRSSTVGTASSSENHPKSPSQPPKKSVMEELDNDNSPIGFDNNLAALSPLSTLGSPQRSSNSLRRRFRELCQINPFELAKSFTEVKGDALCQALLNLEQSLLPKEYHFDFVVPDGYEPNGALRELIGEELKKEEKSTGVVGSFYFKNGRVPSDLITFNSKTIEELEVGHKFAEEDGDVRQKERRGALKEMIEKEEKFIKLLKFVVKHFLLDIQEAKLFDSQLRRDCQEVFTVVSLIAGLHEKLLESFQLPPQSDNINSSPTADASKLNDWLDAEAKSYCHHTANCLLSWLRNMDAPIYGDYFEHIEKRTKKLKGMLERREFRDYCERVRLKAVEELGDGQDLATILGSLLHHVTRYHLILTTIIRNTPRLHAEPLLRAFYLNKDMNGFFNARKGMVTSINEGFELSRGMRNFPPTLVTARRNHVAKATVISVEKDEVDTDTKFILHLFDDILVVAKQLRPSKGILGFRSKEDRDGALEEFLCYSPVEGIDVRQLQVKAKHRRGGDSREKHAVTYSITLPMNSITHEDRNFITFEQLQENYSNSEEATVVAGRHPSIISQLIIVAASHTEFLQFREKLEKCKKDAFLSSSSARIFSISYKDTRIQVDPNYNSEGEEEKSIFFHLIPISSYLEWKHRSKVAIIFQNDIQLPDLQQIFSPPEDYPTGTTDNTAALLLLQCLLGQDAFRMFIHGREQIVATAEGYTPLKAFLTAEQIRDDFFGALLNAGTIMAIYPPFTEQTLQLQRQQLERFIEPFCRGIRRRLKEVMNRMHRTATDRTDYPEVDKKFADNFSIFSVEQAEIAPNRSRGGSLMGKMFGRISSKLASPSSSLSAAGGSHLAIRKDSLRRSSPLESILE